MDSFMLMDSYGLMEVSAICTDFQGCHLHIFFSIRRESTGFLIQCLDFYSKYNAIRDQLYQKIYITRNLPSHINTGMYTK